MLLTQVALSEIITIISIFSSAYPLEILNTELSQDNLNLIEALRVLRADLDATTSTVGYKLVSIEDPKFKDIHDAVKLKILKNTFQDKSIRISNTNETFSFSSRFSTILIDNISAFRNFEHFIDVKRFNHAGYHTVILLNGTFDDVHEIFSTFWSRNITNVMAFINNNGTLLLSFDPFADPQQCGSTRPKVVNRFKNGKFVNKIVMRKFFSNMNRCPVTVTTFKEGMSVFKETFPNGSYALRGHEIRMIHMIADMLNFTLNLRFRDGVQQWGLIYENGTFTRGFADLNDRKTDILMGDLFIRKIRLKYFDSSVPYLNRPLLLALTPQLKLDLIDKFLSPFQAAVWILLLFTFCTGVTVIFIINIRFQFLKKYFYGHKVKHPITNLIMAFIGQPQSPLPRNNFGRFTLMMTLILCLIIRNLYQGYLYKFLQSDRRQKEPQTVDELIEKEYTFVLSESNLEIIHNFQQKIRYRPKPLDANKSVDLYSFLGTSEKIAYFCSYDEIILYSMKHDTFPFKICKQPFVHINCALIFNKNFFLKKTIDEAIQRIVVYGFIKHWMREFDKTDKWKIKNFDPIVMTFEHLSGAFYLLIIGIIISLIIFLIEILIHKFK